MIQTISDQALMEDFKLTIERNFKNLKKQILNMEIDLAVIDLTSDTERLLPLCASLKKEHIIQGVRLIVILSDRNEDRILNAFQNGADDCVFIPLRAKELVARIKTVLRRGYPKVDAYKRSKIVRVGDLELHNDEYKAYVAGEALELTRSEYKILHILASHPKRVYTRQQLINHCGSLKDDSKGRSVDVHVRSLRLKIGLERDFIKTARGIGYYFEVVGNN